MIELNTMANPQYDDDDTRYTKPVVAKEGEKKKRAFTSS